MNLNVFNGRSKEKKIKNSVGAPVLSHSSGGPDSRGDAKLLGAAGCIQMSLRLIISAGDSQIKVTIWPGLVAEPSNNLITL